MHGDMAATHGTPHRRSRVAIRLHGRLNPRHTDAAPQRWQASMAIVHVTQRSDRAVVECARLLMREYAELPHAQGRWPAADAEIALLPSPYLPPDGAFLLAAEGKDVLGCGALLALGGRPGYAEIKRVYVRPAARGHGIGEAITRALLDAAGRLAFRIVRLDTAPELLAAQALYRRLGFEPIPHYREGLLPDALCFERAVD